MHTVITTGIMVLPLPIMARAMNWPLPAKRNVDIINIWNQSKPVFCARMPHAIPSGI